MIKKILHLLAVIAIICLISIPIEIKAFPISVSFERIRESPVDVTFKVAITGDTSTYPANIQFSGMSAPIKVVEVNEVNQVSYQEDVPIYSTANTTVADLVGMLDLDSTVKSYLETVKPDTTLSSLLVAISKDSKLLDTQKTQLTTELSKYSTTYQTVSGYDKVSKTRIDKVQVAKFTAGSFMQFQPQSTTTKIFEVTINTGIVKSGKGGWGSKGLLTISINGIDYFDDTHSSWWNNSWVYRQKLTFNASSFTDNLTSFPVSVNLSASNFDFTKVQSAGQDIRFIDSNNTTSLSYEIATWNVTAQQAQIWVGGDPFQIDAGSTTDHIWIYYGNPTATDAQNPIPIWHYANAVGVWHLYSANNSGATVYDSSQYGNNSTSITGTTWDTQGRTFNGINDYIDLGAPALLNPGVGDFTVATWANPSDLSNTRRVISRQGVAGLWFIRIFPANTWQCTWYESGYVDVINCSSTNISVGSWSQLIFTRSGITNGFLYTDGGLAMSGSDDIGNIAPVDSLNIGRYAGGASEYWKGIISEIRLYNRALTADEAKADNMNRLDTLITYGSRQSLTSFLLPPTNFTLTDLGAATVNASWTKGVNAYNTVIVSRKDRYPTSITDGESMYSSSANNTFFLGLSLETSTYYFSAWSSGNTTPEVYSSTYTTAQIGGTNMVFLGFLALPLVLTFAAFKSRNWAVSFMASIAWFILLIYERNVGIPGVTTGDVVDQAFVLFTGGMGLIIGVLGVSKYNERTSYEIQNGERIETRSSKWHLPKFITGEEEGESRTSHRETYEEYRTRIHGLLPHRRGRR